MIWRCMNSNAVRHLHVINGTVNANVYISEILVKKLLPSAEEMYRTHEQSFKLSFNKIIRLKVLVASWQVRNKQELIETIVSSWFHVINAAKLTKLVHSMP